MKVTKANIEKMLDESGYGYSSWMVDGMAYVLEPHGKEIDDDKALELLEAYLCGITDTRQAIYDHMLNALDVACDC